MWPRENFRYNHKLIVVVWCPLSIKREGALDHGGGGLMGENFMVGQIFEEFLEEEGKTNTMDGRKRLKPSNPYYKSWLLWSPSTMCSHCRVDIVRNHVHQNHTTLQLKLRKQLIYNYYAIILCVLQLLCNYLL